MVSLSVKRIDILSNSCGKKNKIKFVESKKPNCVPGSSRWRFVTSIGRCILPFYNMIINHLTLNQRFNTHKSQYILTETIQILTIFWWFQPRSIYRSERLVFNKPKGILTLQSLNSKKEKEKNDSPSTSSTITILRFQKVVEHP